MSNVLISYLGNDFNKLDPLIQQAHIGSHRLTGIVKVKRGNVLSCLLCQLLKLPKESSSCLLQVDSEHHADHMQWHRSFDGHTMNSSFQLDNHYLIEKLGPITIHLRPRVDQGALFYEFIQAKLWGITLPDSLSPRVIAYEKEHNKNYRFEVKVTLPIIGMLISYQGDLLLEEIA